MFKGRKKVVKEKRREKKKEVVGVLQWRKRLGLNRFRISFIVRTKGNPQTKMRVRKYFREMALM
jgi:hypothetical protein